MKPATFQINPSGQRVSAIETRIGSRELLDIVLGARQNEILETIPLRQIDAERELVLIRREAGGESLNDAAGYLVGGHRVRGRALLCARPSNTTIPPSLADDPRIFPAPLTHDEAAALVEWVAPVAGELAGRVLDVQMLDSYCQFFSEHAAALPYPGVVRVLGLDQAGQPTLAFNVPAADWRALRRAALDIFDRRMSAAHHWVMRELPGVRGNHSETTVLFELAEIKHKGGGHSFECYTAGEVKEAFAFVHAEPITGPKLVKRSHKLIAMPGLPAYMSDSGVPILASFKLAG